MTQANLSDDIVRPTSRKDRHRSLIRRPLHVLLAVLSVYLLLAYVLVPWIWRKTDAEQAWLATADALTLTGDGHPGDPINLALIGGETELKQVLSQAGWTIADSLSVRNDLKIAVDSVLGESFAQAPVSQLFYFGRPEDFAFEMPVGESPRHRHHVRFWKAAQPDASGQPVWFGSATYDERVGLSHTTGQVTHHIAPDVDQERDHVMQSLHQSAPTTTTYYLDNFHPQRTGFNGGGDPWRTDGRLGVVKLSISSR